MIEPILEMRDVVKSYGENSVLKGVSFQVRRGETKIIIGGSGSGKSTLLKLAMGLEKPDEGQILIESEDITKMRERDLARVRMKIGMVFQESALFDSMTVRDNVAYQLHEKGTHAEEVESRVRQNLGFVGLEDAIEKFPAELSGGMKRRVAIARALAGEPNIMFYDEPTAGLDPIGAAGFDQLIHELRDALGLTVFLITHDLDTLYAICDRVAVLADKKVVAVGTIEELLALDHEWIQEYFKGPRGRAASHVKHEPTTGVDA